MFRLMEANMKENGKITSYMAMVYILGLMVESMKEDGKILICMDTVNIPGKMEDTMKGIIIMIKSKN